MATLFETDFNSLNNGDLNGQDSWSGDTDFDVQVTIVKEGAKAVAVTPGANGDNYISRTGTQLSAGKIGCYIRTALYCPGGADPEFVLYEGATVITRIQFCAAAYGDGICGAHSGGRIKVADYSADIWYWCQVEWNEEGAGSTPQVRFKVNSGAWSSWYSPENDWATGINIVKLYGYYSSYAKYFDYIAENALAVGPDNLKSVNTITKANIKSINGILIASVKSVNNIE